MSKNTLAGAMKRILEDISVEMGYGGGINEEVMAEGERRQRLGLPPFGSADESVALPDSQASSKYAAVAKMFE